MGLNEGGGHKNFLSITDGKISMRVAEGSQGAIACTNKDKTKSWFERHWPSVSGKLTNVIKRETDYGAKLQLTIVSDGEQFLLEMPWSSRYSSGFFTCMPNIDPTKNIRFSPYMKLVDGVKKTMLYLSYEDEKDEKGYPKKIEWFYTKDNPNGLPELRKIRVKGEDVWDDSDRQDFFSNVLQTVLMPRIAAATHGVEITHAPTPSFEKPAPYVEDTTEDDDLPF